MKQIPSKWVVCLLWGVCGCFCACGIRGFFSVVVKMTIQDKLEKIIVYIKSVFSIIVKVVIMTMH